jgi:hypothetical protein
VMEQKRKDWSFDDEAFDRRVEAAAKRNAQRNNNKEKQQEGAGGNGQDKATETQAQQLTKISTSAGLFHAPNGTGFADITIDGHRETWPIRSKGFRSWLSPATRR